MVDPLGPSITFSRANQTQEKIPRRCCQLSHLWRWQRDNNKLNNKNFTKLSSSRPNTALPHPQNIHFGIIYIKHEKDEQICRHASRKNEKPSNSLYYK